MRGALSVDLVLTAIFVLGMFGAGGTLINRSLTAAEHQLARSVCLMYAQNLANVYAATGGGSITVVNPPTGILSASVSKDVVRVEVNGITGTYSCEVNAP